MLKPAFLPPGTKVSQVVSPPHGAVRRIQGIVANLFADALERRVAADARLSTLQRSSISWRRKFKYMCTPKRARFSRGFADGSAK